MYITCCMYVSKDDYKSAIFIMKCVSVVQCIQYSCMHKKIKYMVWPPYTIQYTKQLESVYLHT